MSEEKRYKVLYGNAIQISESVSKVMEKGFVPYGEPIFIKGEFVDTFYQAVVKYEDGIPETWSGLSGT